MSSVKPPVSRITPADPESDTDLDADRTAGRPDGRSARWASHRKARRDELIEAAIVAISRHGAAVGMDQIAAVAGTSKPVIYRYFADKQDLYRAVTKRVVGEVLATLTRVTTAGPPPRELMHAGVDACFALLDRHPELFRFVVLHPLIPDEDHGAPTDFATVVANLLSTRLSLQLEGGRPRPGRRATVGRGDRRVRPRRGPVVARSPRRDPARATCRHRQRPALGRGRGRLPVGRRGRHRRPAAPRHVPALDRLSAASQGFALLGSIYLPSRRGNVRHLALRTSPRRHLTSI